jgi:hypothetical protein
VIDLSIAHPGWHIVMASRPLRHSTRRSREHQDVEKFGAGSRAERVEALSDLMLELLQVHGIGR